MNKYIYNRNYYKSLNVIIKSHLGFILYQFNTNIVPNIVKLNNVKKLVQK